MKKISTFNYSLLISVMLLSCGKKLQIDPTTQVDQDKAVQDVKLMLIGAYSLIGSGGVKNINEGGLYGTDLFLDADLLGSESYMGWLGTFNEYQEISNKTMSSTNTSVERMWRKGYLAIGLCNTILENLGNASADLRTQYAAEAKFIRAIVLFELVRFYGEPSTGLGVPIMLKSTQTYDEITYPVRNTIDEVYTQVIADLNEAQANLPTSNDVYANHYSALALLARVYLQKGDYTNAYLTSSMVIDSNMYTLPSSVELAFNSNTSTESIFEIQQTNNNNAGTTNDGLTTFYSCDVNTPGSATRGDVTIDSAFINMYDPLDKRRSVLIYEGNCSPGIVTTLKWHNPYTNIPVIRLSEMYLIRAEAGFITGQGSPVDDINQLRKKAGMPDYTTVSLDTIKTERQLELAFEGHRIHDLRRWNVVIPITDDDGNPATLDYNGPQLIMPIPQNDINTNPNLVQNSYYK